MTPTLQRSNVEFSKRVFLDRLTTDAQPLVQPGNIDEGPGEEYEYGGVGDSNNFGVGFDCSGWCGIGCATAILGPQFFSGTGYKRLFSTETFGDWANQVGGWKQTNQSDCVSGQYPIKVMICHGGGGPNSHMAMWLDGWDMESNGDYGLCTEPGEITGVASNYWNDWWVWDGGPINEDTTYRQPMGYPRGYDYAGGRISGADLVKANTSFVCRYLTDGGPSLPGKQLLPNEFVDLVDNGISVVFNWETTENFMLGGKQAGVNDATAALAYVRTLMTAASIPAPLQNPTIYFSCDFDESPAQDTPVEDYLRGAGTVLGGMDHVGLYGPYWISMRAQAVTSCKYIWQTEAWSGGNITSAVNIMQRNNAGYQTVGGVQCDINEAHSDDIGAWVPTKAVPPVPVPPAPPQPAPAPTPLDYLALSYEQLCGPIDPATGLGKGWPQLAGDPAALAALQAKVDAGTSLYVTDALACLLWHITPTAKPPTKGAT